MNPRMKGNFQQCKQEADGFLETAYWCTRDMPMISQQMKSPFVVNLSFACELFLKAIMILEADDNQFMTGHNLENLFFSLKEGTQKEIVMEYSKGSEGVSFHTDLESFLSLCKNSFMDWRYTFSKEESLIINASDFLRFANILKEYVEKKERML